MSEPVPAPIHGVSGYVNYGCRCLVCRAANAARGHQQNAARIARMAAGDPAVPHGTAGGYSNWGCRCPRCTKANTDSCRIRKRARQDSRRATRPDYTS